MSNNVLRTQPDQHEVNCLAAFIEAVEELKHEPFCGEDDKSVFSMSGSQVTARFGDRFHFRSALVTFRRIWLKDEASNFCFICNLIERYEQFGLLTKIARDQFRQHTNMRWGKIPLKSGEVVDLWLNSVFAHTNLRRTKKPQWRDRVDFDKLVEAHGHAMLEFICRTTVSAIITASFNLVRDARWAIDRWEKDYGLRPEFNIGTPFGRSHSEITGGQMILRQPSSEHSGNETESQRFERILARDRFRSIKPLLDSIGADRERLRIACQKANRLQAVASDLGYTIRLVDLIDLQNNPPYVGPETGIRSVLTWHEDGMPAMYVALVGFDFGITATADTVASADRKIVELSKQLSV